MPLTTLINSFLENSVPDFREVLIWTPVFLVYVLFAAAVAAWLKAKKGIRTPFTRKIFHFLIFTAAGSIQMFLGLSAVVLFGVITGICVLFSVAKGRGFPFYEALARPKDEPHRSLFIIIPFICTAVGGVLSNIFFPAYAAVGIMVTGWGDAVAEPVGAAFGKHKYRVPSMAGVKAERSIEGSLSVFVVGTVAATLCLLSMGYVPIQAIYFGAIIALAGTLVEAVSTHGLDNLTIQIAASGIAYMLLAQ